MSLTLTPERLRAAYDCLRAFPPFCRWKLPPSSELKFKVSHDVTEYGHCRRMATNRHVISISARNIGQFNNLGWVLGHEMIHLKQSVAKTETKNTQHNAEFHRLAASVCRRFGWDPKIFV